MLSEPQQEALVRVRSEGAPGSFAQPADGNERRTFDALAARGLLGHVWNGTGGEGWILTPLGVAVARVLAGEADAEVAARDAVMPGVPVPDLTEFVGGG